MSYLQKLPLSGSAASPTATALSGQQRTSTASSRQPSEMPRITFLYKLVPGVANRSFGLNVARMAHLPASVIERAAVKAQQMEEQTVDMQR